MSDSPRTSLSEPIIARSVSRSITSEETWDSLYERIDMAPADAEIRGMFLRELIKAAPPAESHPMYIPFALYPVREYMEWILRIARSKHSHATPADAVLRVGWSVYAVLAASMAGSAIFSVAGGDFRRAVILSPKAYNLTLKPGTVEVVADSPTSATVEMRKVWPFPDIFHAGVWLGGMDAFGVNGEITVTRRSPCDVDFELRWRPKPLERNSRRP